MKLDVPGSGWERWAVGKQCSRSLAEEKCCVSGWRYITPLRLWIAQQCKAETELAKPAEIILRRLKIILAING